MSCIQKNISICIFLTKIRFDHETLLSIIKILALSRRLVDEELGRADGVGAQEQMWARGDLFEDGWARDSCPCLFTIAYRFHHWCVACELTSIFAAQRLDLKSRFCALPERRKWLMGGRQIHYPTPYGICFFTSIIWSQTNLYY